MHSNIKHFKSFYANVTRLSGLVSALQRIDRTARDKRTKVGDQENGRKLWKEVIVGQYCACEADPCQMGQLRF